MTKVPVEILRQLLRYEPETGKLFWLPRPPGMFRVSPMVAADEAAASWNGKHAGHEAFTATQGTGYRQGRIFAKKHFAHRVIWALVHGQWPEFGIDHINHDPADNRLANLRAATAGENAKNLPLPADNSSGRIGVSWDRRAGKWHSYINVNRRRRTLGMFRTLEAASEARSRAEEKHGYHKNHGAPAGRIG
jgi:hypothetical protein